MTIAPPCSAALPTIATTTTAMKNSPSPTARRERVERVDEDLADPGGHGRRDGEDCQRDGHRPRVGGRRLSFDLAVTTEVPSYDDDVDEKQQDRDRHRRDDRSVSLRISAVSGHRRDHERRDGERHETDLHEQRAPVDRLPVRPRDLRHAEHEQEVRDDAARERAADDDRQVGADREESDDQLGCVPEARVEEAADARPGVLRRVLGRLSDQPRERDERERREDEERHLAGARELVDRDRDRGEEERCPEELRDHAITVTSPVLEAVLFDWTNTLVSFEWDDALVEAGHRAALGRDDPEFTARWRELLLGDTHGRRPYVELLAELGVEDPDAFIDAEHAVWLSAYGVLSMAPALLETLRERGLKTALVADPWPDPPRIIASDVERLGFAPLLDAVGARRATTSRARAPNSASNPTRCSSSATRSPMCKEPPPRA